jgi:hypothetical protein
VHQAPFNVPTKNYVAEETQHHVNSLNNLHSMQMAHLLTQSLKNPARKINSNKSSAVASPTRFMQKIASNL